MRLEPPDASERSRIDLELDHDLLVAAGAGSGKTSKLVDRYVALLKSGCEPEQIVVVTFTRKAAGEMKERLRGKLAELADQTGEADWLRRRRAIEEAPIETMDAFCLRLLRTEAIVAGLDPGFEILDNAEQETLPHQVAAQVFSAALRAGRAEAEVLLDELGGFAEARDALVGLLAKRRVWRNPFREPARSPLAEQALRYLAGQADEPPPAAELLQAFQAARQTRITACLGDLAESLLPKLIAIWNQLQPETDPNDKFTPAYRLGQRLAGWDPEAPDWDLLADFDALDLRGGSKARWGEALSDAKDFIKLFREWYRKQLSPLRSGGDDQDLAAARATAAALPLAKQAEAELWLRKQRLGKLGFEDLLLKAAELLASEHGAEVLARVQQRFQKVLVDEYQDSSGLQDRLFRHLAGERPGAFFAVGDDKQSIYGFRDADLAVFNHARETAGPELVSLTATFRLAPKLAELLNAVFSHASTMGPERHEEADDAAVFVPLQALDNPERVLLPKPEVRWLLNVSHDRRQARQLEAEQIAADIRTQVVEEQPLLSEWQAAGGGPDPRLLKYGDIAVLLRTTTDIELYRNALSALEIPCRTERGKLSRRQEAGDLLAAGRWLLNPRHGLATVALLRSPLIGLSDTVLLLATPLKQGRLADQVAAQVEARLDGNYPAPPQGLPEDDCAAWEAAMDRLKVWREWAAVMPIGQVLRKVVEQEGYRAVLAALPDPDRRLANLEKLLDGLGAMEASGLSSDEALAVYETRQSEGSKEDAEGAVFDADADAVSLMSVHNAKGLERPVVYVADLARSPRRDDPPRVVIWRDLPVVAGGAGTEDGVKLPPPLLADVKPSGPVLDFESERLLYVACTRARDRLVLSSALTRTQKGEFGRTGGTWHTALAEAAGPDSSGAIAMPGIQVTLEESTPAVPPHDLDARQSALASLGQQPPSPDGIALPDRLPPAVKVQAVAQLARAAGEQVDEGLVERGESATGPVLGAERGTIVHELLRLAAQRRAPLTIDDARTAAAGQGRRLDPDVDREALEALIASADRALACEVVQRALRMAEVMVEAPFVRFDGEKLIQGRVDLVGIDPGRVLLVDYKTGSLNARLRAQYVAEVGEYHAALRTRHPDPPIEVVLPFLDLRDEAGEVRCLWLSADGKALTEAPSDSL